MSTISVCMIVKDEELTMARVLECAAKFADEIVVVDTGSSDDTVKIASKYTDKVYTYKWHDDFAAARNYSFKKASMDYCMWLDADDVVDDNNIDKIIKLKQTLNADVVMMKYTTAYDDDGNPTFTFYRERLIKRGKFWWQDPIHEVITPAGEIVYSDIEIRHQKLKLSDPKRNIRIYNKLKKQHYPFSPRMTYYYANELYYNNNFKSAISYYKKFLKMGGFYENCISACLNMGRIYINMGEIPKALDILFYSFRYSLPRSEILCEIGTIYFKKQKFDQAIYWYKLALSKPNLNTGAFVERDYYDYIPYVQIGLCYYYLKDYKQAIFYNHQALLIKPKSEVAIKNQQIYLSNLK